MSSTALTMFVLFLGPLVIAYWAGLAVGLYYLYKKRDTLFAKGD